jgi:asparagine synthase (glutamine-hydrolysing)
MEELFAKGEELVSLNEWKDTMTSLNSTEELKDSEDNIAVDVKKLVEQAILGRIQGNESIGICFSGGLDSSFIAAICKKNNIRFTCYTVGFQDGNMEIPEDVLHAREVAKFLNLTDNEFKFKIFNLKEVEEIIKKTAQILKSIPDNDNINQIVNLGVGSVEVAAYSISKHEKFFFSGLGSEEIFAGYDRHKSNPTNEECFKGLLKMHERDLLRDSTVSKSLGFNFLTPFLDKELISYSLKIPVQYKINKDGSKMILRKAAISHLGKFSERPKKAAQYGSSFDKAITKLAAKNGFKTKKEYYQSITSASS